MERLKRFFSTFSLLQEKKHHERSSGQLELRKQLSFAELPLDEEKFSPENRKLFIEELRQTSLISKERIDKKYGGQSFWMQTVHRLMKDKRQHIELNSIKNKEVRATMQENEKLKTQLRVQEQLLTEIQKRNNSFVYNTILPNYRTPAAPSLPLEKHKSGPPESHGHAMTASNGKQQPLAPGLR